MTRLVLAAAVALAVLSAGCSATSKHHLTLYTCASAPVEQAVVAGFEKRHSDADVRVFRAPTGQLNARVAADQRSGGIKADVIWACDPLTMHGYDTQGLLRAWSPPNAADIPSEYRTARFTGIDVLNLVIVVHKGVPAPKSWSDLADPALHGKVVIPSPTFAASALGLLGYFVSTPAYGLAFYQRLKDNGAVQLNAPTDTLTAVEQGRYDAGVTLANAAYADQKKGSPIEVVWPEPAAVSVYAPIGVTTKRHASSLADDFAAFAASRDGQRLMAKKGTYVTLPGLGGPPGGRTVAPDWSTLFDRYKALLAGYSTIYGG